MTKTCPLCGSPCEHEPPREAEPDAGLRAYPGGWWCTDCDWNEDDEPIDKEERAFQAKRDREATGAD